MIKWLAWKSQSPYAPMGATEMAQLRQEMQGLQSDVQDLSAKLEAINTTKDEDYPDEDFGHHDEEDELDEEVGEHIEDELDEEEALKRALCPAGSKRSSALEDEAG